ncbi:MAG: arginine--tRNA ligase [Candidatus Nezhaarchaeota archaeon]|nr:arginine--tRNA ligase [Candidatus Nezhaarchaeota archaeon]
MTDPFGLFEEACLRALSSALNSLNLQVVKVVLEPPPDSRFGDLAYPCFELAKVIGEEPFKVATLLKKEVELLAQPIIDSVEAAQPGYLNFKANSIELANELFKSIRESPELYGLSPADKRLRVIVEHTSGNPVHPLTAGTGRNAFIGDALSRLLKARGHLVERHFYIDDVGFQVALVAYVYGLIKGKARVKGKPDHFIGLLYSIAHNLMELQRLKREAEEGASDKSRLDEVVASLQELRERDEELFDILSSVAIERDLRSEALRLNQAYERGDPSSIKQVREVCDLALRGFRETLSRVRVEFDSWDWESEVTLWSRAVERVIEELKATPFTSIRDGALIFNAEEVATKLGLKHKLGVKESHTIPSLTLTRADGTTLYVTRDIAYALWKLKRADLVISVIGSEQSLAQTQLKLALYALGRGLDADRYVHYAYELVRLPGRRMSARRGRYVTLDQLINEAVARLRLEVEKRWPNLPPEAKERVAEKLGVGAVRFAFLNVSASRPITFSWDQVVNFERNSFPFINYTYVRALGILRKGGREPGAVDASKLREGIERELIVKLSLFPRIVKQAADELKPELLTTYLNELSLLFNSYYEKVDVIHVRDEEVKKARMELVYATKVVLENGLSLLGIEPAEFM